MDLSAPDLGFDELPAEGPLRFLDSAPDVAITLVQVGGRLLDRACAAHRLQDLTKAESKGVLAPGFQPDLDTGDQGSGAS